MRAGAKNGSLSECVYCGSNSHLTIEHAVPAALFPKPHPNDLITVRACKDCNRGGSKDVEYFKTCIGIRRAVSNSASAQALGPSIFRSLGREQASGFRQQLLSGIRFVPLNTEGGVYLGRAPAIGVNIPRIHKVVERIVRCLFLHETGRRLDDDSTVHIFSDDSLACSNPITVSDFVQQIVRPLYALGAKTIGGEAFSYRFWLTPEKRDSVWGITFYESVRFVGLTKDRAHNPHAQMPSGDCVTLLR